MKTKYQLKQNMYCFVLFVGLFGLQSRSGHKGAYLLQTRRKSPNWKICKIHIRNLQTPRRVMEESGSTDARVAVEIGRESARKARKVWRLGEPGRGDFGA